MTKCTTVNFDIKSTELEVLLNYWQEIRGDQTVPLREHFNPIAVPQCLKYILLLDVKEQPPKYFIRLAGSAVNPAFLEPIVGRYLEHIPSQEDLAEILPYYDLAVQFRAPTHMQGSIETPSKTRKHYESLILPLTSNGDRIDKLIVGLKFEDIKQGLLDRPLSKT